MNLPLHYVHDIEHGYGRILLPWFGGWIGWREAVREPNTFEVVAGKFVRSQPRRGAFKVFRAFHNCTMTGVR